MIDGKVSNAATYTTSTMRCYLCGQTSKDFNDLNKKTTESRDTDIWAINSASKNQIF